MAYVERDRGGSQLIPMAERHEHSGWTPVCELDDIVPGHGVVREVNGLDIVVLRDGDDLYALGNICAAPV